jgi:hypothetical protein
MVGPVPNNEGSSQAHARARDDSVNQRAGRHRMPKPGEKNAPLFDTEKPEELGRFFDRIEDWFLDDEVESDEEKKRRIVKYLDADSEIQWKALSKYTDGTYAEFKAQVMSSYPAAEEVMKGSVAALKRKIKKIGPVATDERDDLLSLIRIMTAEVMKLKKISPPIHTNRELVELFLGRLTTDFASRVAGKLSTHRLFDKARAEDIHQVRNPEDMYDIEEVMDMAKHTSMEQTNPFGKFLNPVSSQSTTNVKLEEAVARFTDSLNLQAKYNQQVEQKLNSLQSLMNQAKNAPRDYGNTNAQAGYARGQQLSNSATHNNNCYYCAGMHRIPDCETVALHLTLGWLKRIDGYIRLPDGSKLPKDPVKTTKELVEQMNKPKPGLINMNRIQDKTSLYQASAHAPSYVQSEESENINGAEMQHLLNMVQKLGMEKAQRLLTSQVQAQEEDDEWNQNFE